jgi:hypothetical protein
MAHLKDNIRNHFAGAGKMVSNVISVRLIASPLRLY